MGGLGDLDDGRPVPFAWFSLSALRLPEATRSAVSEPGFPRPTALAEDAARPVNTRAVPRAPPVPSMAFVPRSPEQLTLSVPRISPSAVMGPVHPDTRSAHPLHPVGCSSIRFVSRPGTGRITNIPGRGTGWGVGGGTSDPEAGSPRGLPQPALPRHTKSNVLAAACAVEERQAKCSVGVSGFAP